MEEVKRIPYGVANFVEVMEQNMYYVDKTMYLPLLEEQPRNLFFVRPRGFGKSIFLNMLQTYYDTAQKDKFEKCFGNLWIGSHPTCLQGVYQVLYLDFSRVRGLDARNIDDYCCMAMDMFGMVYESYYFPGFAKEMKAQTGSINKLNFLDRKARNNGSRLYLIIDEYDNFTNGALGEQNNKVGHALTYASNVYEKIFKNFKMKKLIRLDKLDGNRKGVLRKITEEGQIVTTLANTFPATDIIKPEIFPSLLFYYGMLTITATRGNYLVLSIPNNNVRKQYYEFLLEEYQDNRHINLNDLGLMDYEMAYEGHWHETLEFIATAYKENSSVRSTIEGERNLQGFFTAYLSTNTYYLIAPEVELNHGYCDLFLMPNLLRYDVKHSYIVELKYLSAKDSEAKAEAQWQEAIEQIKNYAAAPKVRRMVHDTELHCIIMQFRGWELERMEEVN